MVVLEIVEVIVKKMEKTAKEETGKIATWVIEIAVTKGVGIVEETVAAREIVAA
jgi:hypothetical protein